MLRLLRVLVIVPLLVVTIMLSGAQEAHAVDQIAIYLMPAAVDQGYTGYVRLTCGWHQGCDGVPDDPGYGALDFVKEGGSVIGEFSFWRVKAYSSSPSVISVGKMHRWGPAPDPNNCTATYGDMFKLDGSTLTGRSIYLHVATFPAMWRDIWGKQGAYQNSNSMGTLVDDSGKANCIWTGAHTHQDLQINPGVSFWWGRGSYPTEAQCNPLNGCYDRERSAIWSRYHAFYHYDR